MSDQLINVSDLNQYLYCPRRFWYLHFFNTQGKNFYRTDGQIKHANKSERGGWTNEIYLESKKLGLKGKIDVLVEQGTASIPVERKRGDEYGYNDEIQLTGYCMLLSEYLGEEIREGAIYLYETDQRMHIVISDEQKQKVRDIVKEMRSLTSSEPPSFVDNREKCKKCSCRDYCMPEESRMLGEFHD